MKITLDTHMTPLTSEGRLTEYAFGKQIITIELEAGEMEKYTELASLLQSTKYRLQTQTKTTKVGEKKKKKLID